MIEFPFPPHCLIFLQCIAGRGIVLLLSGVFLCDALLCRVLLRAALLGNVMLCAVLLGNVILYIALFGDVMTKGSSRGLP